MDMHNMAQSGPPYLPRTAAIGGLPTVKLDVPILAVFICLYACGAALNMTILQINLRRKHKFILSGLLFGFCMARIVTCIMRIVWATRPTNTRVAIAANIFLNAGILLVYIVNIIFAQRVLRAKQPELGWNPILRASFKVVYSLIGGALIMVIVSVILSFYTLNAFTLRACRDVQLAATTYLLVITVIPLLLLAMAYLLPRSEKAEHFGKEGSVNTKALIVMATSCLCVIIAGFKTGTSWEAPRPRNNPAWYHGKAAFYVFNFTLEIIILTILISSRVDKKFHVPDGSNGPGDYSRVHHDSDGEDVTKTLDEEKQ